MKKIWKNLTLITSAVTLSAGAITGLTLGILANTYEQESDANIDKTRKNFDENSDIIFNDNYYSSVKDATNSLLASSQVNVKDDLYIGDLNDAIINTNNYNMVNTNKLLPFNQNKEIKKAYKTSLGTHTDDMLKAKKSMIASQETLYLDHEFNSFRSENRAKDSIDSSTLTTPVSYYKVYDPMKEDYVNINPLNKKDATILKEIAINSIMNKNTENADKNKFELTKYQLDQSNKAPIAMNDYRYEKTNFATQSLNNKYFEFLNYIFKSIIENALFDVKLVLHHKDRVEWVPFWNNYANVSYSVNYGADFNSTSELDLVKRLKELQVGNISNAFNAFTDKGQFENKFNIQNDLMLDWGKVFSKNAIGKGAILGYDKIDIIYTGSRPWPAHGWSGDLGRVVMDYFYGGNKDNVKFSLDIKPFRVAPNRYGIFDEKIKGFDFFKNFIGISSEYLNKHVTDDALKIVDNIENKLKLFVSDMIKENSWSSDPNRSIRLNEDDLRNYNEQDKLTNHLYYNLANNLTNTNGNINFPQVLKFEQQLNQYDVIDEINYVFSQIYANENANINKNSIYVIEYNGSPLYQVSNDNPQFGDDEINVLKQIIKNESSDAQKNNEYYEYLNRNIINVSNNTFYDQNSANKIKTKFLTKQNSIIDKTQKLIKFKPVSSTKYEISSNELTSIFDVIDNDLFGKLNIDHNSNISSLKNGYGVLQSIYYYNQNIKGLPLGNLPDDAKANLITAVDDIPILWQGYDILEPTYYGEYLAKTTEVNAAIHNPAKKKVYSSTQEIQQALNLLFKLQPIQLFIIKDHYNNIINFEYLDKNLNIANGKPITDGYGTNEDQAYANTLNKIIMYADTDYVYYNSQLIRNEVNRLYTLNLSKLTGVNTSYTFTQYKYMYNYFYDYIKLYAKNIY